MGIKGTCILVPLDQDELFEKTRVRHNVVVLNDVDVSQQAERDRLQSMLVTVVNDGKVPSKPKCECGELEGDRFLGVFHDAPYCGSTVRERHGELIHNVWVRCPDTAGGFLNGKLFIMLQKRLKVNGIDLVSWVCDPTYPIPNRAAKKLGKLALMGVTRGYNNFMQHFHEIVPILLQQAGRRPDDDIFMEAVRSYGDLYRNRYWPAPNAEQTILEITSLGKYTTATASPLLKTLLSMVGQNGKKMTVGQEEKMAYNFMRSMATIGAKEFADTLQGKGGAILANHAGGKTPYTCRAVITQSQNDLEYDEIELPWTLAVTMFHYHFTSLLIKKTPKRKGLSLQEANTELAKGGYVASPNLREVKDRLLADAGGRLPGLLTRNPTLQPLNIAMVFASNIKEPPEDHAISIPLPMLPGYAGDLDGDALAFQYLTDKYLARLAEPMRAHYSVFGYSSPGGLGWQKLAAPIISTADNYISNADDTRYNDQYTIDLYGE
jgi:hypothetical protein